MTAPRFESLRFVLPELDAPSPQGPGLQHSPQGGVATVDGADSVRQALLLLISTRPGERVNRPTYGCDLHRLVFAPADDTTAGLAMHYVQQAVIQWEPRVDIVALDAVPRLDPRPGQDSASVQWEGGLTIQLTYRLKSTAAVDTLAVTMSLGGSGA